MIDPQAPELLDDTAYLKRLWQLDPRVAHLNHASFGAVPRSVLAAQAAIREQVERNPNRFLRYELADALVNSRAAAARVTGAPDEGLCLVENATAGVAAVLSSYPLHRGDNVVVASDLYSSVRMSVERYAGLAGATVTEAPGPFDAPVDAAVESLMNAIGARTRLVVLDHVSSSTARVWPVTQISRDLQMLNVDALVDAAHAPGPIPRPADCGAAFWVGNLHKWHCSPRGSAVLAVAEPWRGRVSPAVPGHGNFQSFPRNFEWRGTYDVSAFLSLPAVADFWDSLGGSHVWTAATEKATKAAELVAERWQGRMLGCPEVFPMFLVEVPRRILDPQDLTRATRWASDERGVEVVGWPGAGTGWLRLSIHAYCDNDDVVRMMEAIEAFPG